MLRFYSFYSMLHHFSQETPDAPALLYGVRGTPMALSFRQLAHAVEQRAQQLRAEKKTCLGILCDGSFFCVTEIFAAARAGLQLVLLDENADEEILREQIAQADVDSLWGPDELCEALAPALTAGTADGAGRILFFTSGTTDRAKAVVLTEASLTASAWNGGSLLPLSPADRLLCLLPLNHVFGFVCGLLWGLSCGAPVALGRGTRYLLEDCAYFRPTALSAVPLLWGFLLSQRALNQELATVLIGAGDCPEPLLAAGRTLGIRVCFGYGLTETSSGVALSLGEDPRAMTVCPDNTVTIAADGEILVTAQACMMQGYYKQPEATTEVLRGGVLATGDLGHLDEAGRLHVTGRKKEMLVLPDGTKVFLPEYEAACAEALGTRELAVCERDGALTLVLGQTEGGDERAVLERLRPVTEQRPRGQQLRRVEFRNGPLPRTAAGKLKRWEL